MADAIRTLGLGVDATSGIRSAQQLTGALKETGAASDVVTDAIAKVNAQLTASAASLRGATLAAQLHRQTLELEKASTDKAAAAIVNRIEVTERAIAANDRDVRTMALREIAAYKEADAMQAKALADAAATEASKAAAIASETAIGSTSRLIGPLRMLADQALGVNRATGSLATGLLSLGASSGVVLGVVAGGALIGGVYDVITEKSRAAAKAQDESLKSLQRLVDAQRQGAGGQTVDDVANARKRQDDLVKQRDELKRELDRSRLGGGGDPTMNAGATYGPSPEDIAAIQKNYDAVQKKIEAGNADIARANLSAANSRRAQYGSDLTDLVKAHAATDAENAKFRALIKADKAELAGLDTAAAAGPLVDNTAKRLALIAEIKSAEDAINPASLKAAENHLASVEAELNRLKQSAAEFGKEASIDNRVAVIVNSLDALEKKFPTLTDTIERYKTQAALAGDALKAGELAKVTTELDAQYNAAKQLYDAAKSGSTAYGELTASRAADLEIAQRQAAIGVPLSDALKQEILQTKELAIAAQQANETKQLTEKATALHAETVAIQSGASTRVTYSADLDYQIGLQKAAAIASDDEREKRIAALTALHDEATARAEAADAAQKQADAIKRAGEEAKKAAAEHAKINEVIAATALHLQSAFGEGLRALAENGLKSFTSLFTGATNLTDKFAQSAASSIAKIETELREAQKADSGASPDDIFNLKQALTNLDHVYEKVQKIAAAMAGAQAGFNIGQTTTDTSTAVFGGAASGAAAGSAAGPWGALIGGLAGIGGALLGSADAARKAREEQLAFTSAVMQYAIVTKTAMAQQLQENAAKAEALLASRGFTNPEQIASTSADFRKFLDTLESGSSKFGGLNDASKKLGESLEGLYGTMVANERAITALNAAEIANRNADLDVLDLRNTGLNSQADAQQAWNDSVKAYNDSLAKFGDEALASRERMEVLTEWLAKVAAEAERVTRSVFDINTDAQSYTDPRGAAQAAFDEEWRRKIADAGTAAEKFALALDFAAAETARQAALAESDRRGVFTAQNSTLAFNDPRAANEAAFLEQLNDNLYDKIRAGASDAEVAAIAFYNAAAKANYEAKQLEQDTRTSEGLASKILGSLGNTRATEDYTKSASDRQATVDAATSGASDFNKGLLAFSQRAADSVVLMNRSIEDTTATLTAQAAADTKENNNANKFYQANAAQKISDLEADYKAQSATFDGLLANSQRQVTYQQAALQTAQSQLTLTQKSVDALADVNSTLKLGDLSTASPGEKLAQLQSQFDTLVKAALGGDRTAAAGVGNAATAYLTQDKAYNGNSAQYGSDFAKVTATVSTLQTQYTGLLANDTGTATSAQSALDSAQVQVGLLNDLKQATLDGIKARESVISADAQVYAQHIDDLNKAIFDRLPDAIATAVTSANDKNTQRIQEDPFFGAYQKFVNGFGTGMSDTPSVPTYTPTPTDTNIADQLTEMRTQNKTLSDALVESRTQTKTLTDLLALSRAAALDQGNNTTSIVEGAADNTRTLKQAIQELASAI